MSVLVVGEAAVVGSSLCRLVPRMSQLTLGVAVAQSETRSSPPSPTGFDPFLTCSDKPFLGRPFLQFTM